MPLIWLPDLRLHAALSGPGAAPPLVLIHGLGLDARVWDALVPLLPRQRVLRLDLRGHGASDTPAPPYALGSLIRDVEQVIDHCKLRDAVILGAGEGGLVAQGLAVKRLDQVRGLVLTGSAARLANPGWWQDRIRARAAGGDPLAESASLLGPRGADHPAAPLVRAMLAATRPAGWEGVAAAVATADLYQTTATLTLPALILAGGEDRKVPPDLQRETADLIPGAELQILPGACHLAMLTEPESFAARLSAFLTRIGHD
jgi:3-oxoadipate enol-lactonase